MASGDLRRAPCALVEEAAMVAAPSRPATREAKGAASTRSARAEPDPPPDIEEARRRIASALAEGAEELDLGGLNLREVPEEVLALTGLTRLHLGRARSGGSGLDPIFGDAR